MEQKPPIQLIWFCVFLATLLYNALIFLIYKDVISLGLEYSLTGKEADMLFYALLVVAMFSTAFSLFFADRLNLNRNGVELSAEKIRSSRAILKMAFAEAVGIYGLVFFLVSGLIGKALIFGVASIILLLRAYPQSETV